MKPSYFNSKSRVILACAGGLIMIFAAENEHPLEVVDDPYFILNWLGASFSVYAVFTVQHITMRLTDKLCPFKVREPRYYQRRAMIQFLVSFLPSLLTAIGSAWLLVTVIGGVPLGQTSYFLYDIYIVLVALIGMQFFKGYQHYEWTRWQYEEVSCWTTDSVIVYPNERNGKEEIIKSLRYQRIVAFLDAWQEDTALPEEPSEKQVLALPQPAQKSSSKAQKRYATLLEKLDWSTVAIAYASDKLNFIIDWEGNRQLWDTSLDFLIQHMDPESYFEAGRHLIVHRSAIENVEEVGNSLLKLELIIKIPIKTRMSRIKSREFKYWYEIKEKIAKEN